MVCIHCSNSILEDINGDDTKDWIIELFSTTTNQAEQVLQMRQLLTTSEIEKRIQEARLRRDHISQEAQLRRCEPKMRRAQQQLQRQTYLSEMARKRNEHEESKMNEY